MKTDGIGATRNKRGGPTRPMYLAAWDHPLVQNDTSDTPLWKRHELGDGESRFPREKTRPARQAGPRPAFIGNGRELLTVADMLVTEFLSTPFAICSSMASDICIQPLARLRI
jgi:hypothetical protein